MHLDDDAKARIEAYVDELGGLLNNERQRASFALYAVGLFSTVKRKTAEAIATLFEPDPERVDAMHQRLLHIVGQATWSDRAVRRFGANYAIKAIEETRDIDAWILDDTGWVKKGKHSVGVQRQYTGTSGKIDNCQLGVSLCVSAGDLHVPIDFELYLPKAWTDDAARRKQAKIPSDVVFRTKIELADRLLDKACEDSLPKPRVVLADSFYGNSSAFRSGIRSRNLHYAVGIKATTKVHRVDKDGSRRGPATTVERLLERASFRKVTWTQGSRGPMASRFAFLRVMPMRDSDLQPEAVPVWLILEWPFEESEPRRAFLSSLPKHTSHRQLAFLIHQRWRIERSYEDLKQEFGLDHYEGRSFVGWHHHVSVALACYAFVAAEQARLFPPRRTTADTSCPYACPPREALRLLNPNPATRALVAPDELASSLPNLPSQYSSAVPDWAKTESQTHLSTGNTVTQ
jgi:SRSO17 transposase